MKILIALLLLSPYAIADTPIYQDEKFIVSVEEKPSRPGARGKGPCGAGQEIFLQVKSVTGKKTLLNELIESCLKEIDLEESVEESVTTLGKQIFVLQEKGMGILDLNGEAPVYKAAAHPAEEVKSLVMRLENCHHWGGEEPTDEKRKKEITTNMTKLGCEKLPAQIEAMKKKHAADADVLSYLDAASKEYQ